MNNRQKIKVHPPKISPKISSIGHGNPRYNSMIVYQNNLLIPVSSTLRLVDLKNNKILYNKQIGSSQIFQIHQNDKYIYVVNFEGLITLLSKENLQIKHQFSAAGKQIRHSCINNQYIVTSSQLIEEEHKSKLEIFSIEQIQKNIYKPKFDIIGDYYYPQIVNGILYVVEHHDPNPKGRSRIDTVLQKKLPIKHKIVSFDQDNKPKDQYNIQFQGDIVCANKNSISKQIYYLHSNKKLTIYNPIKNEIYFYDIQSKSTILCIQSYKNGIIYASASNTFTYLYIQNSKILQQQIIVKSLGVGGNIAIRASEDGYYLFNDNGLHYYSIKEQKDYTQSTFNITNCGLSFNPNGSHYVLADFGGSVYVFQTQSNSMVPNPLSTVFIGVPIRCLTWCHSDNLIIIGCVDGSLHSWNPQQAQTNIFYNFPSTINALRCSNNHIFAATSLGQITIFQQSTLAKVFSFKAHHPIDYEDEKDRQLFGSMKNYAQIWSLAISPVHHQHIVIVSCSQDQTEKIHAIKQGQYQLLHHLKGHHLAVTSVDWKIMGKGLGQIYASCSDDKIVRLRNPQKNFEIMFQIQTSTIKEWHTLTYLSLEPNGHRIAVGTQNGYLFIYDIADRSLLFGQKVHLGGIEGLDWRNNKICTISSDLCVNVIEIN